MSTKYYRVIWLLKIICCQPKTETWNVITRYASIKQPQTISGQKFEHKCVKFADTKEISRHDRRPGLRLQSDQAKMCDNFFL